MQKPDQFTIGKLDKNGTYRCMYGTFDSIEEAEKSINSQDYGWRNGDEVIVMRVSYHAVARYTANLSLKMEKL